jgi:Flp pilus assembly protein TadD
MKITSRNFALLAGFFSLMLQLGCASMVEDRTGADKNIPGSNKIEPAVHIREGDKVAANGEFDKALVQYVIALEGDDTNAELYYKVGFIHQSEGRIELAERSFREALKNSPDHVPARISLGLIALRKENFQYAEVVLDQVLEQDPLNWRALNALGVLGDLREDFSRAREFYDRALVQTPDSINVLNNLGYSLYLQGQWKNAEKYFKQVVDKDPEYAQGWSNLALVYLQLGDENMAKIAFLKVVNEHQALNNMGYFNLLRKDVVSAREKLKDATRVAPFYYALAYRNLASIDASVSEPLELVPDLEPTAAQTPEGTSRLRASTSGFSNTNEIPNRNVVRDDVLLLGMP